MNRFTEKLKLVKKFKLVSDQTPKVTRTARLIGIITPLNRALPQSTDWLMENAIMEIEHVQSNVNA